MTEDRLMVATAVFSGQIGEEYLTQSEIDEMMELVADEVFNQAMDEAEARGCTVFDGIDGDPIH